MFRKLILPLFVVIALLVVVACGTGASTSEETTEAAPVQEVAQEEVAEAEATEPLTEEVAAEEDTAAEAAVASDEASSEEAAAEGDTVTYTVDTAASMLEWYGSKPVGASESGTVSISEGELIFAGTDLVQGAFVIDMTSIDTTTQSGDMKQMLEDHLRSDEFFGVENYPTAHLVIKAVEPTAVENQYNVVADLTIKETTDEITFVTDVIVSEGALTATAAIVVDRSIFDVRYNSAAFFSGLGDNLISDEMELTVNLVARS